MDANTQSYIQVGKLCFSDGGWSVIKVSTFCTLYSSFVAVHLQRARKLNKMNKTCLYIRNTNHYHHYHSLVWCYCCLHDIPFTQRWHVEFVVRSFRQFSAHIYICPRGLNAHSSSTWSRVIIWKNSLRRFFYSFYKLSKHSTSSIYNYSVLFNFYLKTFSAETKKKFFSSQLYSVWICYNH